MRSKKESRRRAETVHVAPAETVHVVPPERTSFRILCPSAGDFAGKGQHRRFAYDRISDYAGF